MAFRTAQNGLADEGTQNGIPETRQDSQEGVQEAGEDAIVVPSTRYRSLWRTFGQHSERLREHVLWHLDVQKWSGR